MGKKDASLKQWFKDNRRFADLFNGACFDGKQIIKPEELKDLDGESGLILRDKDGKHRYEQRYRDVIKGWRGLVLRGVLGIELQEKVHYAMPIKNMMMDSLSYTDQMKMIWDNISDTKKKEMIGTPDYFSRFRKDDKLCPVITLVFYDGDDWDGATQLFDMFEFDATKADVELMGYIKKYVPNYHINLFCPTQSQNLEVFKTDLQTVFGMLKSRKDKETLRNYIYDNREYFSCLDYDSCNAIVALLGTDKLFRDDLMVKGDNDMCKAIDDLYEDGIELGREQGQLDMIINLIKKNRLSIELGAEELGISVEELELKLA